MFGFSIADRTVLLPSRGRVAGRKTVFYRDIVRTVDLSPATSKVEAVCLNPQKISSYRHRDTHEEVGKLQ
jgi:hypothetical protein